MDVNAGDAWIWLAYTASNGLRLVSYAPQICRIARDTAGAQAISCLSWNLWTAANAATALYAWTQLGDLTLTAVNAGNALCCAAVVALTLVKRAALARRARAAPAPSRGVDSLIGAAAAGKRAARVTLARPRHLQDVARQ